MIKEIVKTVSEKGFRFFTTEKGIYILGDAREVLKLVPSSSIDAIVTDPPWGVEFDEYDNYGEPGEHGVSTHVSGAQPRQAEPSC